MELYHGTEAEHQATYERTKAKCPNGIDIWSGDLNLYLAENLNFIKEKGLAKVTFHESHEAQESSYHVTWV